MKKDDKIKPYCFGIYCFQNAGNYSNVIYMQSLKLNIIENIGVSNKKIIQKRDIVWISHWKLCKYPKNIVNTSVCKSEDICTTFIAVRESNIIILYF